MTKEENIELSKIYNDLKDWIHDCDARLLDDKILSIVARMHCLFGDSEEDISDILNKREHVE